MMSFPGDLSDGQWLAVLAGVGYSVFGIYNLFSGLNALRTGRRLGQDAPKGIVGTIEATKRLAQTPPTPPEADQIVKQPTQKTSDPKHINRAVTSIAAATEIANIKVFRPTVLAVQTLDFQTPPQEERFTPTQQRQHRAEMQLRIKSVWKIVLADIETSADRGAASFEQPWRHVRRQTEGPNERITSLRVSTNRPQLPSSQRVSQQLVLIAA